MVFNNLLNIKQTPVFCPTYVKHTNFCTFNKSLRILSFLYKELFLLHQNRILSKIAPESSKYPQKDKLCRPNTKSRYTVKFMALITPHTQRHTIQQHTIQVLNLVLKFSFRIFSLYTPLSRLFC